MATRFNLFEDSNDFTDVTKEKTHPVQSTKKGTIFAVYKKSHKNSKQKNKEGYIK